MTEIFKILTEKCIGKFHIVGIQRLLMRKTIRELFSEDFLFYSIDHSK